MAEMVVTNLVDVDGDDEETGRELRRSWSQDGVGIALFYNALQVWSVAQNRPTTVDEAALAFNTTPAIIRQAVEGSYWMFIVDDVIEHEGE